MKKLFLFPGFLALVLSAHATITVEQLWHFDDTGENYPVNSGTPGNIKFTAGDRSYASVKPVGRGNATPGYLAAVGYADSSIYGDTGGGIVKADNFGVEFWVRSQNTKQATGSYYTTIFMTGNTTSNGALMVNYTATGFQIAKYSTTTPNIPTVVYQGTTDYLADGKWHAFAVVSNAGKTQVFVDRVKVGESSGTVTYYAGASHFHVATKTGGSNYFVGDIDELRYFTFDGSQFNPANDLYKLD